MRRLRVDDDDGPAAYSEGVEPWCEEDDDLNPEWFDEVARAAELEAREERREIEDELGRQAAGSAWIEDADGEPLEPRAMDLAAREPIASPRSELRLTDAQRRVAGHWRDVARREDEVILPFYANEGEPVSTTGPVYEDVSREDATRFLRTHDPLLTPDGVRAEVDRALATAGLKRDVLPEAFRPGKPSAARVQLRTILREALTEVFEADRRRDYMADALGCSPKALYRLMAT